MSSKTDPKTSKGTHMSTVVITTTAAAAAAVAAASASRSSRNLPAPEPMPIYDAVDFGIHAGASSPIPVVISAVLILWLLWLCFR